jgi:hypothetical protein
LSEEGDLGSRGGLLVVEAFFFLWDLVAIGEHTDAAARRRREARAGKGGDREGFANGETP